MKSRHRHSVNGTSLCFEWAEITSLNESQHAAITEETQLRCFPPHRGPQRPASAHPPNSSPTPGKVNAVKRDSEAKRFINVSLGRQGQMHLHNPR